MKSTKGFPFGGLAVLAILIFGTGGWIANIVKIIDSGFDVWNGMLIARVIGVFMAPLGAVLGYC